MHTKYLALATLVALSSTFAGAQPPEEASRQLIGTPFGSPPSAVANGLSLDKAEGDLSCYNRDKESFHPAGAAFSAVGFCYYKDRLIFVSAKFQGSKNAALLKALFIEAYGPPTGTRDLLGRESIWWNGPSLTVAGSVDYDRKADSGEINLAYLPLKREWQQAQGKPSLRP